MATQTIGAADFKARCLDILDRLGSGQIERVIVTKRGKAVAVLTPPASAAPALETLHGFMRGSVIIPPGFDLTEPVFDEAFDAMSGALHR